MVRRYNIRKTISMKQFIAEFGENFSQHMKNRLMELEVRCVLTRGEEINRLELKHVEHTRYNCHNSSEDGSDAYSKEYAYGQLLVVDGVLYFSESHGDSADVMQSPVVSNVFDSLSSEGMIMDEGFYAKKVDDSNIDFVIDTILTVFPQVSQSYLDIMSRYGYIHR